jgi:hypothetical protein
MIKQIINPVSGTFIINSQFTVSNTTTANQVLLHFAAINPVINDFKNGYLNITISRLKIEDWYFILTFCFFNENITKLSFILQSEPFQDMNNQADGWTDFNEEEEIIKGKFMKIWLSNQLQGTLKKYYWGEINTNYDLHNLSTSCAITYKTNH